MKSRSFWCDRFLWSWVRMAWLGSICLSLPVLAQEAVPRSERPPPPPDRDEVPAKVRAGPPAHLKPKMPPPEVFRSRNLNSADLSFEGRVVRRGADKDRPPPPGTRPPPSPRRESIGARVPAARDWEQCVFEGASELSRLRMAGTGETESEKTALEEGSQAPLRLQGRRTEEALRTLPTHPIPVLPNTRFEARIRLRGDARIQFTEYDESGESIGRQWTQPFYFEASRSATYTVKTSEWTRWIVVQVDNPGDEELVLEQVELRQGELPLWGQRKEAK